MNKEKKKVPRKRQKPDSVIFNNRITWVALVAVVLAVALVLRLGQLQIVQHSFYAEELKDLVEKKIPFRAPRGTIFDRNGNPLALSEYKPSLYADPVMLKASHKSPEMVADLIAPYVSIPKEEVVKKLSSTNTAFVWIDRMMPQAKATEIEKILDKHEITALRFKDESERVYPNGRLAAQVLGYVNDTGGLDGVERKMDDVIKGDPTNDTIMVIEDAKNKRIFGSVLQKLEPEKKRSVTLTIDLNIQFMAERALNEIMRNTKPVAASIVIMDPKTGEILAMANRPTFDPNDFGNANQEDYKNRAITNMYEPGSTFKPIIASAALATGKWTPETTYEDKGTINVDGQVTHNWDDTGMGTVRLVDILKHSINTGMVKIGLTTGFKNLQKYIKAFGFGKPTGIEFDGEARGLLFQDDEGTPVKVASMSIGQSVAVTPLQMVQAYSAFVNHGVMMKPHIIKSINNPDGSVAHEIKPQEAGRPIPASVADTIAGDLVDEVSEGGGHKAHVEGYEIAGKTGTAQKINPNGGYLPGHYIASFIGFGPINQPRFIVLVVIDDPTGVYYGGQIAAPVFKEIATQLVRYFQLPPTVATKDDAKDLPVSPVWQAPKVDKERGKIILPDFTGWTWGEVRDWLNGASLEFRPVGTGRATSQEQDPGSLVDPGSAVTVRFSR